MRISDWSSDVCSSDLRPSIHQAQALQGRAAVCRHSPSGACSHGTSDREARWNGLGKAHHWRRRSEEHTSELQSLMRISYAVFCLTKHNSVTLHTNNLPSVFKSTITYRNNLNSLTYDCH